MESPKRSLLFEFSATHPPALPPPTPGPVSVKAAPAEKPLFDALEFIPLSQPMARTEAPAPPPAPRFHEVHVHQPGRRRTPAAQLDRRAFLTCLFLGGLSLALVSWGAFARLNKAASPAGNYLRSDSSFSKLKATSAEAPAQEAPAPAAELKIPSLEEEDAVPPRPPEPPPAPKGEVKGPQEPELIEPAVPLVPPPLPPPAPPEPRAPEPPVPAPPVLARAKPAEEPPAVPPFQASREESPMLRTWKLVGWSTLLAAAVTAAPALAQDKDTKAILERLDKMEESWKQTIRDIAKDISGLNEDVRVLKGDVLGQKIKVGENSKILAGLDDQVMKIRKELDALRLRIPAEIPSGIDRAALDDLRNRVAQLEQALRQSSPRVSLSPPTPARVMLVNQYSEELLFRVNDKDYRVAAGNSTRVEGVPSGNLTYEVLSPTWGRRALKTTTLSPSETFTITAHP